MLYKRIAGNIRKYREAKGLSQGDLAKKLSVDNSYISSLERGTKNYSVDTLDKVARALGVTIVELVEQSKYQTTETSEIMPYVSGLIDAKEKVWQGRKWYHQRFDGAPYLIHMIGEAQITTHRDKKYGLYFDRNFCFYEDGKADWYIDMYEIDRVTSRVMELSKKFPNLGTKLMKEYEPYEKAFYAECDKVSKTNLYKLSDRDLVELHDEFTQATLNRNSSSSMIDGFALGTDRILEEKIKKAYEACSEVSTKMSFPEVFSSVTTPTHSSFVRDAELGLFELIMQIRAHSKDKKKLIREYQDKYFWIRNNYVDAHVLTTSFFEDEIAQIESSGLDVEAEMKRVRDLPNESKKKKEGLLKKLKLDKETRFLLSITEDFTQWQDERKKATMVTAHYATLILDEIGRRVNISSDLLKYMSPREISRIFLDTPPVALLQERQKSSVMYWDDTGHEIVIGENIAGLRKKLLGEKDLGDIQDFRGMTASLGKTQGRVRILRSAKEVGRIKEGEVLVAVMTRPDYVPAMKKACAIVTDEGGITSHAAIVSRELKIPCVIGTKIATQVLRDGDLVQVNANHGLVKIIERGDIKTT